MRDKSKKLTVVNTGSDRFKGYSSKDAQRMVSGTRNVSGIWELEGAGGSSDYLSAINDDEASGIISFLKGLILDGVLLDETLREDDERLPTDHNIMTSSRVLKELTKLDTRYLRKDKDDRSKGKISSNKGFEVGQFVSGASGASLHMEKESGRTVAELDKLYVRIKAIFETLEIVNVNSVGGKQIISPAGAMKCLGVQDKVYLFNEEGEPILDSEGNQQYEELDFYRCYFLAEQDGEKIENRFKPGDQVYCKLFNAFTGVGNKIRSKWYWRLVENVNKNEDAVEYDGKLCHYIDLSKTICDVDSDIPEAGDIICHRGSLNDVDRQNFLEFSSVDSFSPSITLYQGVGGIYDRSKGEWVADYSLIGKDMVQFGVNTSTGKAFMNVYGDMYVGERSTIDEDGNMIEPKSYLRFVQGQGLEVKGKISVNSTIGDSEEETLGKFITDVHNDIQNLQNQVDGAIESFFYDYVPTLENYPASEWIETGTEELHLNDTFTHTEDGRSWRWVKDKHGVYSWAEISDTQSAEALRLAVLAKDTADGKRRVFITTADNPHPNPPYDPGDLWTRGSEYPLLVCVVQKQAGQYYEQIDWALADNTEKVKEELDVAIKENAKNLQELNKSLSDTKDYIDGAFSDGIITESEKIAIGKYINQIETVKEQADESYGQVYNNELLLDKANDGSFADSTAKINLKNAYDVLSTSIYDLIEKINSVIEDDEATSDEIADVDFKYELFNQKYGDYIRCLNAAINYIELKINSKVEQNIIELGGYSYLKEALKDGARTEINGGLVQSTLLALGEYSDDGNSFKVWAGTSGIYDERKIGNGIASWYGGGNIDRFDYYDYTNNVFNVPSGIRAAAGVDRMDGTGYRANGNLWWDKDGVVHADPLSFFIGEATVGGLLASFQVVMKSDNRLPDYLIPKVPFQSLHVTNLFKIGSGSDSVELKYDSSNNALYIQKSDGSPVNFYSTGGISMYGQGDVSVKTIMDAIIANLDKNTLTIENGLLTVVGGINTGIDEEQLDNYLKNNHYATEDWVKEYIVEINTGETVNITKQMVIDALEYTPYDASNPNGYITSATLDGYLPLTGGTISNVDYGALIVLRKSIQGFSGIRFSNWSGVLGYLGIGGSASDFPNQPTFIDPSLKAYGLIHSGNIGSQSVNWANGAGNSDMLDGKHIGDISKYIYTNGTAYALTADSDLNNITNGYFTTNDHVVYKNAPTANFGLLSANLNGGFAGQLLLPYNSNANRIRYRSQMYTNGATWYESWCDWKELAYITDNVASATKLQTPRTIWGQSFDGTGDVGGLLTSGGVTMGLAVNWTDTWNDGDTDRPWFGIHKKRTAITSIYSTTITDYGGITIKTARGNISMNVDGNVGIGTTSPSAKLHVYGDVKAENGNFIGNLTGTAANAEKFAGVDFATLVSIIPTNTNQLENGAGFITSSEFSSLGVITTSNYDSYALRADGWLSVDSNDAPRVYRASGVPYINFRKDGSTNYGSLGVNENGQPVWFDDKNGSGWHTLIHSQNIVHQSVNWANSAGNSDMLDGKHLSDILASNVASATYATSSGSAAKLSSAYGNSTSNDMSNRPTTANNRWTDKSVRYYLATSSMTVDKPITDGKILHLSWDNTGWDSQLFVPNTTTGSMQYRATNGDATTWESWKTIVDSNNIGNYNAGSATKLQTARTIWGQSFDGTGNVNGVLTFNNLGGSSPTIKWSYGEYFDNRGNFHLAASSGDFNIYNSSNNVLFRVVHSSGNVGIGTTSPSAKLHVNGNILSTGGITMYSARILKNIVDERGLSLNELSVIKPTRYTWKDGRDSRLHFGGIADDIQQVLPEVVYKTEEGVLTMDYGNAGFAIAASLIKPVVDHEQRIKALERENELLKQELNRLRA